MNSKEYSINYASKSSDVQVDTVTSDFHHFTFLYTYIKLHLEFLFSLIC